MSDARIRFALQPFAACCKEMERDMEEQEFEAKLVSGEQDELDELKAWLFEENIRLEVERKELKHLEDKFLSEKTSFQKERDEVNRRLVVEKQRLKQDELFFEKKMEILKNGFAQLEAERRKLEHQKIELEAERNAHQSTVRQDRGMEIAEMLFQGVNSHLALKKRYRDLIKMFHPDNIAGDHEMVLVINRIYEELKQELTEKVSMYETMVYTDDQIKEAKADKANLNKLKKA